MTSHRAPATDPDQRSRLGRCREAARAAEIDTLVFSAGEDLRYLTGHGLESRERLTALVVPVSPGGPPRLVLPVLEHTAAADEASRAVSSLLSTWSDGEDAAALVAGYCSGRVAVSPTMAAQHVVALQNHLGVAVHLTSAALDPVRSVKSSWECDRLADAARRIDDVHAQMAELLVVGQSEREAAGRIRDAIVHAGLTHPEFVIVASGPNGADPHHEVSDRLLRPGDVVVVDIGGPEPAGYHSDCTRTYALGRPDATVHRMYEALGAAHQAARESVRPGIAIGEVDAAARTCLNASGLGEYFLHRTGHGIGLGLHEEPFAAPGSDTILEQGMVFTVEPGIYLTGRWGARLEDVVQVTSEGYRSLNRAERTLRVLPG